MGRRTAMLLDLIRFLRTTDPKYTFEVMIFHITLGLACITFTILDESRLWGITFAVLCFSLGIQWWRVRRVVKRELEWFERATISLEQAIAAYEQAMRAKERKPLSPAELALLREDVERARKREAASGE